MASTTGEFDALSKRSFTAIVTRNFETFSRTVHWLQELAVTLKSLVRKRKLRVWSI